nr:MAG TPA: hypothetical protein [Caudoviricetes sp.]
MTREQAIQIATNFFAFREGGQPYDMTVKGMHGDKFILHASSLVTDERVYEIAIDPLYDEIVMKEVVAQYRMSEFVVQPCKLSTLKTGDTFRNEGDCVIYEYYKPVEAYGDVWIGICRKGKSDLNLVKDRIVYPCGK